MAKRSEPSGLGLSAQQSAGSDLCDAFSDFGDFQVFGLESLVKGCQAALIGNHPQKLARKVRSKAPGRPGVNLRSS